MQSIFKDKAIKCDTWEQMLQLAEMAEKERLKPCGFNEYGFNYCNSVYFSLWHDGSREFSNFQIGSLDLETIIPFTEFIKSVK